MFEEEDEGVDTRKGRKDRREADKRTSSGGGGGVKLSLGLVKW
jgi:hypothetical protein